MKGVKIAALVAGVLLLLASVLVFWVLPSTVRSRVEAAASRALGVQARLGSASLDCLGGGVTLESLVAPNPPGFAQPAFLEIRRIDVAGGFAGLRQDPVRIAELTLTGLSLTVEQAAGGSNVAAIRKNIEAGRTQPARRWEIGRLRLVESRVRFVFAQGARDKTVDAPDLEWEGITNADGGPAMLGDLVQQIAADLVAHGVDHADLPAELRASLLENAGPGRTRVREAVGGALDRVKQGREGRFGKRDEKR